MKDDPRVTSYIERQADFARPILETLRARVRKACPDGEETMKWGMPHFLYKGRILAGMAAFKAHATFGFWKGSLVVGRSGEKKGGMGQFGRLASLEDLPEETEFETMVRRAMDLTDQGVKAPRNAGPKPPAPVPEDLARAIAANPEAAAHFAGFPPSARRDYCDWISEAKRPETRARRLAEAVGWIAEGKRRNWKYEGC